MNRLTTHDAGLQPYVIPANESTWRDIYNKLIAYEDLDCEPEEIDSLLTWCKENGIGNIVGLLNAIALDNVGIVQHGEWWPVEDSPEDDTEAYDCSECIAMVRRPYNYCPRCGSKNVLKDNDDGSDNLYI